MAAALEPFHPKLRGLPDSVPNVVDEPALQMGTNFTLDLDGDDLDLLAEMSGIGGYDDVAATALELEVDGHRVKVLSLERLIATKRAAGRAKDLAMLPRSRQRWRQRSSSTHQPLPTTKGGSGAHRFFRRCAPFP